MQYLGRRNDAPSLTANVGCGFSWFLMVSFNEKPHTSMFARQHGSVPAFFVLCVEVGPAVLASHPDPQHCSSNVMRAIRVRCFNFRGDKDTAKVFSKFSSCSCHLKAT